MILEFSKPNPGGEPIYMQIVRQFKLLVLQKRLKSGDAVPSRRVLAAQLGVNPNTVQKAFAELEKESLIATPPNAKSVVHVDEAIFARIRVELLEGQISALVEAARDAGLDYGQLASMLKMEWEDSE